MQFLDTNVLLRHFVQDDDDQSPRSSAFFSRVESGEIDVRVSDIVVFEAVYVLERRYRQAKPFIRELMLRFLELPGVVLPGKRMYAEVFALYAEQNISFPDAYHALLMQQLNLDEVVTFDRDFDRVPWVSRVEP